MKKEYPKFYFSERWGEQQIKVVKIRYKGDNGLVYNQNGTTNPTKGWTEDSFIDGCERGSIIEISPEEAALIL